MNNDLAKVSLTSSLMKGDTIIVEQGGSIKRISFNDLLGSINAGDEQFLKQVAWRIPLEASSNPKWGVYGNTALRDAWNNKKGRYLLTNAGKAAKLSRTNSNVYADGTTLDASKGHIMTIKPAINVLVLPDSYTGENNLWCSEVPLGGFEIGLQCTGAMLGSLRNGALTSTFDVYAQRSLTITQFWNYAQVNGKNFGLADYNFRRYRMIETLSDFGSPNIQAELGYGPGGSSGNSYYNGTLLLGATMGLGDANGIVTISGDACNVSHHGTEDDYNLDWEMTQGVYFGSSSNSGQDGTEMYIYDGNRVPSSAELASVPNGTYRQITRNTNGSGLFVIKMTLGDNFDLMPTSLGGSSSTYWCDKYWGNTTGQLLLWGGASNYGAGAGVGCASSANAFSISNSLCGARLAYYGDIQFVDGREIA
jgi:hypothetical protein